MDTTAYNLNLEEVVVTGTRRAENVRFLPMTVSIISRQKLTQQHQTSVLPTVMQQVPGVFVTSRSMMGYGVSTGAAGGINMRGITGGAGQLMVLIDGHPQYQGIYGHPISDSYQTMMAERVEVLRGPASVLYGSEPGAQRELLFNHCWSVQPHRQPQAAHGIRAVWRLHAVRLRLQLQLERLRQCQPDTL